MDRRYLLQTGLAREYFNGRFVSAPDLKGSCNMQGIRGAVTVENDTKEEVINSVQKMLKVILAENEITSEDIGAAIFSATDDIKSLFPAFAARQMPGWNSVPLFDAQQLYIENSLRKCIRVLLLVNTDKSQKEIKHVYLGKAAALRPDIR